MDGLTAVVTDGAREPGASVAKLFAELSADVVVGARDADDADAVADEIADAGGDAVGVRTDVRDEFDLERLMETAARFGSTGIDVVVANASVAHGPVGKTPLASESYSAFDDAYRTNARGVFATVKEAVPHLAGDARVLIPTAPVARESRAGHGGYAVSKAAAEAVMRGFAAELDQAVGCLDLGIPGSDVDPAAVAELFLWAATDLDPAALDGEVVGEEERESA